MRRWTLPLLVIALAAQTASACSIPVFRYALEHWLPDPFMVVVFHRGDLTDEQIALLEKIDARDPDGKPTANVMVKAVDVDREQDSSLRRLWDLQEAETLPWMVVHAPARSGPPQRIWGGELTAEAVEQLLQSPARDEIASRLIDGDSVVWVYVASGDHDADDAAYQLLTSKLAQLETTLRLPEIEQADFGELSVVPESLRMAFSALRVEHDDAQESQFINMLRHAGGVSSTDDSSPVPLAFPIFGRGRAFDALVGENLTEQTIEDACRFLTGACQCTVKSQNPGIDLLMSVDWDGRIEPTLMEEGSPPPLVGLEGFAPDGNEPQQELVADASDHPTTGRAAPQPPSNPVAASGGPRTSESGSSPVITKEFEISKVYGIDVSLSRTLLLVLGALAGLVLLVTLFLRSRGS